MTSVEKRKESIVSEHRGTLELRIRGYEMEHRPLRALCVQVRKNRVSCSSVLNES